MGVFKRGGGVSNLVVGVSLPQIGVSPILTIQWPLLPDVTHTLLIWVVRFYFKQQDLKETCIFPFSLANQNICQRSTPLSRSLESHGCRRRSTGLFFHPSKCLFSPSFFTFSCQLFFCFFPGKAEPGLWMENVNEAFRLNAPGWGSVPCDPTSARRRKNPVLDQADTTMDFSREATTQKQSNSTNRWAAEKSAWQRLTKTQQESSSSSCWPLKNTQNQLKATVAMETHQHMRVYSACIKSLSWETALIMDHMER